VPTKKKTIDRRVSPYMRRRRIRVSDREKKEFGVCRCEAQEEESVCRIEEEEDRRVSSIEGCGVCHRRIDLKLTNVGRSVE